MQSNSHLHCVIIFPFLGLDVGTKAHGLLKRLLGECRGLCGGFDPVVIYEQRCRKPEAAKEILEGVKGSGLAEVVSTWSVDTCQSWLAGWGHVLDTRTKGAEDDSHRIILLPGDLENMDNEDQFFDNLKEFIRFSDKPFLVGDFDSVNPRSAKELIDTYGVYPLVANWFPDAWKAIQALQLHRPRSEFLNITIPELRKLLNVRVFAYEQTLNMLIVSWFWCWHKAGEDPYEARLYWKQYVEMMYLGKIADNPANRNYRGAIDQIERTERMLRMLWRELQGWNPLQRPDHFRELAERYERLDERSTRIRDAARIAIWAQLSPR